MSRSNVQSHRAHGLAHDAARPLGRRSVTRATVCAALLTLPDLGLKCTPAVAEEYVGAQSLEIYGAAADDLGFTTVDLYAVWNVTPQFPIVGYVLAGAGYACANLDDAVGGEINDRGIVLTGSNSFVAHAGVGAKYLVIDNLYVDVVARYLYLNRLVSDSNQNRNTAETALGVGWRYWAQTAGQLPLDRGGLPRQESPFAMRSLRTVNGPWAE